MLDTTKARIVLPEDKLCRIVQAAKLARFQCRSSRLALASLQGLMVATIEALHWGRLHSRPLQAALSHLLTSIMAGQTNRFVSPRRLVSLFGGGRHTGTSGRARSSISLAG